MTGQSFTVIMLAAMATLLAACSKEPPKCSDDKTIALVRQIIIGQIGGSEGLSEKVIQGGIEGISEKEIQENLKVEFPRASSFDEKIKKYRCEAKMTAGGTYEVPITYDSQLDDNGQHIVAVGGMSMGDFILLRGSLVTGIRKNRATKSETAPPPQQTPAAPAAAPSSSISGTWNGSLAGDGQMEVKPAPNGFDIALNVSSPSGCSGTIEGTGQLSDNMLTLTKKEDDQVCTISIKFAGDTASINENNCSSYHGVACGFDGTLKKVK